MKLGFITVILLLYFIPAVNAQQLVLQGKITYERLENMHRQMDDERGEWVREMKKRMPKFRKDVFQLAFNTQRSVYRITKEEENAMISQGWWRAAWNNTVSMDFDKGKMTVEKAVYEKNYHIEDSVPAYVWKLTGEYREIAGYNCKRATTIIMDSLYVIAFYTDEIPVSGGPESFTGLPGMILGIVVPKIHYTYFATKVEQVVIPEKEMEVLPLRKAIRINRSKMLQDTDEAVKDWGDDGRKIYWKVLL